MQLTQPRQRKQAFRDMKHAIPQRQLLRKLVRNQGEVEVLQAGAHAGQRRPGSLRRHLPHAVQAGPLQQRQVSQRRSQLGLQAEAAQVDMAQAWQRAQRGCPQARQVLCGHVQAKPSQLFHDRVSKVKAHAQLFQLPAPLRQGERAGSERRVVSQVANDQYAGVEQEALGSDGGYLQGIVIAPKCQVPPASWHRCIPLPTCAPPQQAPPPVQPRS